MTMTLRVVVADDEPLERQRLVRLLRAQAIEVVAACSDTSTAVETIRRYSPDIVFLEAQQPRLDGFDVLTALGESDRPPTVVFVTSHQQHAVRAFEVHAFDYLLKPVEPERLHAVLRRAASFGPSPAGSSDGRIVALLEELTARERAGATTGS